MNHIVKCLFVTVYLLLSCSFKINADSNHSSLIREDRIWESLSSSSGIFTSHFFKFKGTEMRDGTNYHRLVSFKKISYELWPEIKIYNIENDIEELHALMREEDGVIYTYIDETCIFTGKVQESQRKQEYVLYNFNKNEDEYYESIGFFGSSELFLQYNHVSNVESVYIGGENCRRMILEPSEFPDEFTDYSSCEIIEGIGFTEKGCLFYNEFLGQETGLNFNFDFLRAFDNGGNLIYGDRDWQTPGYDQSGVNEINDTAAELILDKDKEEINIESPKHVEVSIFNMQGILLSAVEGIGKISVSTNNLQRGIYIATVKTEERIINLKKFVIY